jgi:trans-aconitate methyltransferase
MSTAHSGNRADQTWDAGTYDQRHNFVWRYGAELIELLQPRPGERILDLGCGTSHLTNKLAESGARVIGLDRSPTMLAEARRTYPHLPLVAADARQFAFAQPLDAVFSNAVLHWILEAERVVECVAAALRPGGRFVAELGGHGNVQGIRTALHAALDEISRPEGKQWNILFFPTDTEYAALLERHGFAIESIRLFERPTKLDEGERGMRGWLEMFERGTLQRLSATEREAVLSSVERQLRPHLRRETTEGPHWIADYVRLRLVASRR